MATKGGVQFQWQGNRFSEHVKKLIRPKLKRAAAELRTHVVRKISEGKTRVDGPSAPGEPPHIDTGELRKSIFWDVDERKLQARVGVGAGAPYGAHLELGTRRMAARPFLQPSLDELWPRILKILTSRSGR